MVRIEQRQPGLVLAATVRYSSLQATSTLFGGFLLNLGIP